LYIQGHKIKPEEIHGFVTFQTGVIRNYLWSQLEDESVFIFVSVQRYFKTVLVTQVRMHGGEKQCAELTPHSAQRVSLSPHVSFHALCWHLHQETLHPFTLTTSRLLFLYNPLQQTTNIIFYPNSHRNTRWFGCTFNTRSSSHLPLRTSYSTLTDMQGTHAALGPADIDTACPTLPSLATTKEQDVRTIALCYMVRDAKAMLYETVFGREQRATISVFISVFG
jgi:hypothetical protein